MRRLRSQDGFTLPELLVTMVIAMILSLATFSLIEVVMKRSGDVGARVETTATGRTAMDQITRQLRSQVCAKRATMGTARSIDAAGPASLTVFADFTNENVSGGIMPAPDLRTISWANNIFTETVVKGTRKDTDNSVSYSGTGTSRQFLTSVVAAEFLNNDKTKPIFFRYYKFPDAGTVGANAALPNEEIAAGAYRNLTDDELLSVARITISFDVLPKSGNVNGATMLQNEIYVRTADPNAQSPKPTCLTY
ncbi:prepilin-type N-terminal cleavage/methylation domain-containing protein [Solirubrobacter taibaiensis]|nr:prepilin-type N-terminal cleavage/methylation domain-containing protein [Solirubrobacter taibaiensis]